MYWQGNYSSPLYKHSICSKSLVALFKAPAGEYFLNCSWTGWSVVGLVCPGYPSLHVCPGSPSSPVCPGYILVLLCVLEILVPMSPGYLQFSFCSWSPRCDWIFKLLQICEELSVMSSVSNIKMGQHLVSWVSQFSTVSLWVVQTDWYESNWLLQMCEELSAKSSVSNVRILMTGQFKQAGTRAIVCSRYVKSFLTRAVSQIS